MNDSRIEGKVVWIKLTQGKETCVDLSDWGALQYTHWCAWRDKKANGQFYAVTNSKGVSRFLHRRLLSGVGKVDHKDGNGLNNCRANLRPATQSQNQANCRKKKLSKSGFKGVHPCRDKWQAHIKVNGKLRHIGTYTSPEEAARAYNVAALHAFGEFASPNTL